MKTYRELYFKGTSKQLSEFVENIGKYAVDDWQMRKESEGWEKYLIFDYKGSQVDKACVSIYIGREIEEELMVGNIIPLEKSQLSVDEYNAVLLKFYDDIIKPYKESGTELNISQPSDDIFDPTSVISKDALGKLKAFCNMANKSTGSSHPNDQERWFDFICQTVDDDKMFDSSTLAEFLQDEGYWNKKPDGFIGTIGSYAWSKEKAWELALEYEALCGILQHYKNKRGI